MDDIEKLKARAHNLELALFSVFGAIHEQLNPPAVQDEIHGIMTEFGNAFESFGDDMANFDFISNDEPEILEGTKESLDSLGVKS